MRLRLLFLALAAGCVDLDHPVELSQAPVDATGPPPSLDGSAPPDQPADRPEMDIQQPPDAPAAPDAPSPQVEAGPREVSSDLPADPMPRPPDLPADPMPRPPDLPADPMPPPPDTAPAARPCTPTFTWATDFTTDPTTQDLNGDGMPDFKIRFGEPFNPAHVMSGVWNAPVGTPLDTNPIHPFDQRTVTTVRFRSTAVPKSLGAVFWVNLDQNAAQFSALFASLNRTAAGTQSLVVNGKSGSSTDVPLFTVNGLPDAMITLKLDIDPKANTVDVWVESVHRGRFSFPRTGPPNGDRYANLITWWDGGSAQFGAWSVQLCAP